jgi:hypothetical protein
MAGAHSEALTGTGAGSGYGANQCEETAMARLRGFTAGAVVTGLMVLGVAVPASAQTLTWSVVPSPNAGVKGSSLGGVSCVSATECTAVGSFKNSSDIYRTLIESWDGTSWTGVPSRNAGPASSDNYLNDVSCASATACMAVGYFYNSSGIERTLTESWNGTTWTVLHSPNPVTAGNNVLSSVSCSSATACTAVGNSEISDTDYRTLIESWDGTSWTAQPSRNPVVGQDYLFGVFCSAAAACTAVGVTDSTSGDFPVRTLIESWNGSTWTQTPSPNPGPGHDDILFGVSCASATACVAVGNGTQGSGASATLIESWNGTSWTVVPSPNEGSTGNDNGLADVSCVSATACTAVGSSGLDPGSTLIESWDGTSWAIVPSPDREMYGSVLAGVSCISATACTAAGYSTTKGGEDQTLIESGTASS